MSEVVGMFTDEEIRQMGILTADAIIDPEDYEEVI